MKQIYRRKNRKKNRKEKRIKKKNSKNVYLFISVERKKTVWFNINDKSISNTSRKLQENEI